MTPKEIERISKALGDPNRLKILEEIKKNCSLQCSNITGMLNLAQPSISHHVKQLVDAGLIIPCKDGRNMSYTIDKEHFAKYLQHLGLYAI